jgi:hypothetical protein
MIINTETIETHYPNGQLAHVENIAHLSPDADLDKEFPNCRIKDGKAWIRVGRCAKFWDNGQLHWEQNYDQKGNLIKEDKPSYRKDGTVINHPILKQVIKK